MNEKDNIYIEHTHKELIIQGIVEKAIDGDWKAIELIERLGCFD